MPDLAANPFFTDSRFTGAKQQILDALVEHQQALQGIRPPRAGNENEADYDATIARFSDVRGGKLFYPYLGTGFGRGPLVELADGSVKYDMITGVGVHFFGHNYPPLVAAGLDAAVRNTVMQGNLQQNIESFDLARTLRDVACREGAALEHCFLTTSGATANENALKLAFHHRRPADRILAFDNCFMGRTMTLAHLTDRPGYRDGLPQTVNVDYVPFFDHADPAGSTARTLAALEGHIARHPGRYAVMCLEMIQGEGGYYVGDHGFFAAVIEVLKQNDILVLIDEIQTFGRTTQPFAFQHFGLDEAVDIATVGKMTQCCATLFTDALKPKPGLISQTFTGSTGSIFAAQTIIDTLLTGDFFGEDGRIMQGHRRIVDWLERIGLEHPGAVSGPFGLGGMIAFTPFDGRVDAARGLVRELFGRGVVAFTAGANPSRVRFLPPLGVMTGEEIDEVGKILEEAMGAREES